MGRENWTILIICDRFITKEVLQKAITDSLNDSGARLTFKFLQTGWPDVPSKAVEDVVEAVGDIDEIAREAANAHIIVTQNGAIGKRVIYAAPKLKLIAVTRGGPVNVNIRAAEERNVRVVNAPGRNDRSVAEYTLGLILAHSKKIAECHANMKKGIWSRAYYRYDNAPRDLNGRVAGLIGFGRIGRLMPPMLKALGMHVLVYDPYVEPQYEEEFGITLTDLESLLGQSDVVSVHARVTRETVGLIGETQFRLMKPSAFIVNSARGPLMDYQALYRALKEGRIAGAALDTYDIEPVRPDHPLIALPNVTLTPHIAGSSKETAIRSARIIAEDIERFVKGKPLKNLVTKV